MCGVCGQNWLIFHIMPKDYAGERYEEFLPFFWFSYIQDGRDLRKIIKDPHLTKSERQSPSYKTLKFCRAVAEAMFGDNWQFMTRLISSQGKGAARSFGRMLARDLMMAQPLGPSPFLPLLHNSQVPLNQKGWQQFMLRTAAIVDDCEKLLGHYHCWWCRCEDGSGSDVITAEENLAPQTEEIHQAKAAEGLKQEREFLERLMPQLFLALAVVARHRPDAPIIRDLAIDVPQKVSDFWALDLWLNRLAFRLCIRKEGVDFIVNKYARLSWCEERIVYCLLKNEFDANARQRLIDKYGDQLCEFEKLTWMVGRARARMLTS